MVILADAQREIGSLKNANVEFDVNNKKMFTVQIARCYWTQSLTFDALVYVPDTEYGGIIGSVLTDTTLDYVELAIRGVECWSIKLSNHQPEVIIKKYPGN